jgi:hypothetical protein
MTMRIRSLFTNVSAYNRGSRVVRWLRIRCGLWCAAELSDDMANLRTSCYAVDFNVILPSGTETHNKENTYKILVAHQSQERNHEWGQQFIVGSRIVREREAHGRDNSCSYTRLLVVQPSLASSLSKIKENMRKQNTKRTCSKGRNLCGSVKVILPRHSAAILRTTSLDFQTSRLPSPCAAPPLLSFGAGDP